MNTPSWNEIERCVERGAAASPEAGLAALNAEPWELPRLMAATTALRRRYFGDRVTLCSILNAKSGACSEDCAYCAQSAHHQTTVQVYGLKNQTEMVAARDEAACHPIAHFGVVTSGEALKPAEVEAVARAVGSSPGGQVAWCASLGGLSPAQLRDLKAAGLRRFHHNLETARSFFPRICTTHSFDDRLRTIRAAREAGLEVCSGGILGLGESLEQRVEFAVTLAEERVNSIPVNFLVPIAGTRLEGTSVMQPLEMLKAIMMFRLLNPRSEIRVCAGRGNLRDLQGMIFYAGATAMMVGNLLTIPGRAPEDDLRMLRDLGLEIARSSE